MNRERLLDQFPVEFAKTRWCKIMTGAFLWKYICVSVLPVPPALIILQSHTFDCPRQSMLCMGKFQGRIGDLGLAFQRKLLRDFKSFSCFVSRSILSHFMLRSSYHLIFFFIEFLPHLSSLAISCHV